MSELALHQEPTAGLSGPIVDSPPPPGSEPLRNPRHERYARYRSLLRPRIEAARAAGYDAMTAGNAAKLDRKPAIATRIAWLARQDEDVLRAKRVRLEEFLWAVHETNYAEFFQRVERPMLDDEGDLIVDKDGNTMTYEFMDLKPFDQLPEEHQRMIQALNYTEKGRPKLELYSKMQANQELRKLLGIGANPAEGMDEYARLADVDLIATLRREAAELGIDVDLTYRFKGIAA